MTYLDIIRLRDIFVMHGILNGVPEKKRIAFEHRFEAACKTADEWLFEQLCILLDGQDKAEAILQHLNSQIALS